MFLQGGGRFREVRVLTRPEFERKGRKVNKGTGRHAPGSVKFAKFRAPLEIRKAVTVGFRLSDTESGHGAQIGEFACTHVKLTHKN